MSIFVYLGKRDYSGKVLYRPPAGIGRAAPDFKVLVRNRAPKKARVKGAIANKGGEELKYVDTATTVSVFDTTGWAFPVNLLAVGDDNTTRDGRQVCIKSVQVRGKVVNTDSSVLADKCRMMLVWDNANNSAATTSAQFIALLLTSASSRAFPSVDNANRFTILWDSHFTLGLYDSTATQAVIGAPCQKDIDVYKRINQITQYSGTTAVIDSIQNGSLWLVTIGDVAVNAGHTFLGQVRVRFTDQ